MFLIARKNKTKNKKSKSKDQFGGVVRVRLPKEEDGEVLGQVVQTLGGGLLLVRCMDGKTRKINIPGKHRKRMWTRVGDVVIVIPQYGLNEDERGTLEHRYRKNEANDLFKRGLIPEEYIM